MPATPLRTLALLAAAALVTAVLIAAPDRWRPAEAAAGSWTGQYWNNTTFSGAPVLTRDDGNKPLIGADPTIDFFWDQEPIGPGVNPDGWAVRWERTEAVPAATYRFSAYTDDGMRVYVDTNNDGGFQLVLDAWFDQPPTNYVADFTLPAGTHKFRVEFYDATNAATAMLSIQDAASLPPGWSGEYFNNKTLSGSPVFTRNDGQDINFDWNIGSPAPSLPADNFSVRWTRTFTFNEGVYQFFTTSDDGSRVFIDGQLILDFWVDQPPTTHIANKQMTAGEHTIVVEYYEAGGGAMMQFGFQHRPDLGGFATDVLFSNEYVVTAFDFAPDGRIFVGKKDGTILVWEDGSLLASPFYVIPNVNDHHDRGLLGLALDPDFAVNGYVYVAYTYENNAADPGGIKTAQVIRLTADGNVAVPGSQLVLLGSQVGTPAKPSCDDWPGSDCIPSDYLSHTVGNLKFGPDGMLYVATGDGASFSSVDSRALRAQDVNSLAGKVLRVDPANGQGLASNPFYNGDLAANRAKVWAYGFRNPYRFNFKPGTNTIFIGDVGWSDWEEINVVEPGANYGWPCYEGDFPQPGYQAFSACQALGAGSVTFPLHDWEHPPDSAAVGGDFVGVNDYASKFHNTYWFGDYARDMIGYLKVDASDNLVPGSVDTFTSAGDGPVQIETGPDGNIYYIAINAGELRRVRYVGDNRPPVAVASADPIAGLAPLQVSFSSAGSFDPDAGQALTYHWDFGDGTTSTSPNPVKTYTTDGNRTVTLTVTDPFFVTAQDTVLVQVGNTPPVATISSPADESKYDIGQVISFSGSATDAQDASPSLAWSVLLLHCFDGTYADCHTHPHVTASGPSGQFTIADHGDFIYYEVYLTATDSGGLTDTEMVTIRSNTVDLTFTSNQPGIQLVVDGASQAVPFTRTVPRLSQHTIFAPSPQSPAGPPLHFQSWSDGGPQQHEIVAGANATYTANFAPPTATPTDTPTPTSTSTPTATPTPT
ncbi:MAG TPA: PQQ-dependent sugar dehydrogenase, partial [Dehalococcoidia bacterium]|nr:PQQ-dependent sugar dehydrogenase [Dehalococcoidia bacterium]